MTFGTQLIPSLLLSLLAIVNGRAVNGQAFCHNVVFDPNSGFLLKFEPNNTLVIGEARVGHRPIERDRKTVGDYFPAIGGQQVSGAILTQDNICPFRQCQSLYIIANDQLWSYDWFQVYHITPRSSVGPLDLRPLLAANDRKYYPLSLFYQKQCPTMPDMQPIPSMSWDQLAQHSEDSIIIDMPPQVHHRRNLQEPSGDVNDTNTDTTGPAIISTTTYEPTITDQPSGVTTNESVLTSTTSSISSTTTTDTTIITTTDPNDTAVNEIIDTRNMSKTIDNTSVLMTTDDLKTNNITTTSTTITTNPVIITTTTTSKEDITTDVMTTTTVETTTAFIDKTPETTKSITTDNKVIQEVMTESPTILNTSTAIINNQDIVTTNISQILNMIANTSRPTLKMPNEQGDIGKSASMVPYMAYAMVVIVGSILAAVVVHCRHRGYYKLR